jgi:hypothetical protein
MLKVVAEICRLLPDAISSSAVTNRLALLLALLIIILMIFKQRA